MESQSEAQRRKSIRLRRYDYRRPGYYFITLCAQHRRCLFGDVTGKNLLHNTAGNMIIQAWEDMAKAYQGVDVDVFTVMPNHLHGIIVLHHDDAGATTHDRLFSLPDVVHHYKSWTTRLYANGVKIGLWERFENRLWQRNYYEHVIRNETELNKIRQYIQDNPQNWIDDEENPANLDKY